MTHRLRTLCHTGIRWRPDNRINEILPLSDLLFRAVDTGSAAVAVVVVGELSGDARKEPVWARLVGQTTRGDEDMIGTLG